MSGLGSGFVTNDGDPASVRRGVLRRQSTMKSIVLTSLLFVCLIISACAPSRGFEARVGSIVRPYRFSIVGWEFRTLPYEVGQRIFVRERPGDGVHEVIQYFSYTERIRTVEAEVEAARAGQGLTDLASLEADLSRLQEQRKVLERTVERVIEQQLRDTLIEQGIFNPVTGVRVSFPPVDFVLGKPPDWLVISPRDKIEAMRELALEPSLSTQQMDNIEASVDQLGVSSLVVETGGLGATYPTLVANNGSLRFTLNATAEEWLHQYLFFKPLGFLYVLDSTILPGNYEIATMNETLAGMVSKEIASMVYEKYYSEYDAAENQKQAPQPRFDFNREMREIRIKVDAYLANGEIEQAEEFMNRKQEYLASKDYYIRKLNQAYFAFHGTYADDPTSVSPIGDDLRRLRAETASLKDFLNKVAAMTSWQELRDSLK